MWMIWTRFQFRMRLGCDKPRVIFYLDQLDETAVGKRASNDETMRFKFFPVVVIKLEAVAMALGNRQRAIGFSCMRTFNKLAVIRTETHGAALFLNSLLGFHKGYDGVRRIWGKFCRMCIRHTANMTGKFNDGALHAEAETKEWKFLFPCVLNCLDLPFDTAVTESAGNKNPLAADKDFIEVSIRIFNCFRVDPANLYRRVVGNTAVMHTCRQPRFSPSFSGC